MKEKIGKKKVKVIKGGQKNAGFQEAFEDFTHLAGFAQIELKSRSVGAAIIQRSKTRFCFVFGFNSSGLHDTLLPEQIPPVINNIESALKELLPGERMTVHLSSFAADADRQDELDTLIKKAPSAELRLLLMSEKARTQELKRSGTRKPKKLHIYVTYTIEPNEQTNAESDWVEKAIAKCTGLWESFKGGGDAMVVEHYRIMLERSLTEGYMRWEQLLNIKMGLEIKQMNVQELWENLWSRLNTSEAPTIPQYLKLTEQGLDEVINTDIHPSSVLIQGEHGQPSVPKADRRWVKVKGRYVGALSFTAKPAGFVNTKTQLRYLWDVLCRPQIVDTEIICQITSANANVLKANMQRLLKQSNVTATVAQSKMDIDVGANVRTRRTIQAQEKLYEGAFPVRIGVLFLVHRDTISQLDEACTALSECFQLPAVVVRETEITWQLWLQTLSISWDKLLGAPFKRQLTYLTNETPGFIPLTLTRPGSKSGFELIADEGGSPVRIDFVKEHRNIAVFGTTRSGKSVMVSGMLTQFMADGYPIVALDYPKPDGSSTFSDYAEFLKPLAAYFDIGKESNNLLEQPDLRHLPVEQQKERFEDYKSFLESALVTMVLPSAQEDAMLEQTVRSLVGRALLLFFKDFDIQERYEKALDGGFGSEAWKRTPTLSDFMTFCSLEKLGIEDASGLIRNAQAQIHLQLDYWLNSRIGKAIGRPSSFPTDSQLLVFALRNLSNENEAAILSLSAYSAALRRALGSPKSIFFIDESPILFAYKTISQLIGRLCANGAKAGIRVFLSAQDPNTIMNSVAGQQIMQNMSTRLIGRIQTMAVESFVRLLQYERMIVARNASESFFPKRSELYSSWLLDIDGSFTYCRYYPSSMQIATVANNPDEQAARSRVLAQYPNNKLLGMAKFAEQYCQAIRNGSDLDLVGVEAESSETRRANLHVVA